MPPAPTAARATPRRRGRPARSQLRCASTPIPTTGSADGALLTACASAWVTTRATTSGTPLARTITTTAATGDSVQSQTQRNTSSATEPTSTPTNCVTSSFVSWLNEPRAINVDAIPATNPATRTAISAEPNPIWSPSQGPVRAERSPAIMDLLMGPPEATVSRLGSTARTAEGRPLLQRPVSRNHQPDQIGIAGGHRLVATEVGPSSKPVRRGNPTLGRFDSGAAPSGQISHGRAPSERLRSLCGSPSLLRSDPLETALAGAHRRTTGAQIESSAGKRAQRPSSIRRLERVGERGD